MRVTIDSVGRVVIPKVVRVSLGLGPDTELELLLDGAGLRLEPVRSRERQVDEHDGFPLLGFVGGAVLTDDDVRRLRDDTHR